MNALHTLGDRHLAAVLVCLYLKLLVIANLVGGLTLVVGALYATPLLLQLLSAATRGRETPGGHAQASGDGPGRVVHDRAACAK